MNEELENVAAQVFSFAKEIKRTLGNKTTDELKDLQHLAEASLASKTWSVRVAADIIRSACILNLDERK